MGVREGWWDRGTSSSWLEVPALTPEPVQPLPVTCLLTGYHGNRGGTEKVNY